VFVEDEGALPLELSVGHEVQRHRVEEPSVEGQELHPPVTTHKGTSGSTIAANTIATANVVAVFEEEDYDNDDDCGTMYLLARDVVHPPFHAPIPVSYVMVLT